MKILYTDMVEYLSNVNELSKLIKLLFNINIKQYIYKINFKKEILESIKKIYIFIRLEGKNGNFKFFKNYHLTQKIKTIFINKFTPSLKFHYIFNLLKILLYLVRLQDIDKNLFMKKYIRMIKFKPTIIKMTRKKIGYIITQNENSKTGGKKNRKLIKNNAVFDLTQNVENMLQVYKKKDDKLILNFKDLNLLALTITSIKITFILNLKTVYLMKDYFAFYQPVRLDTRGRHVSTVNYLSVFSNDMWESLLGIAMSIYHGYG
jgi:hypothetical protein